MALAVCLLFDSRAERLLRQLWHRLEDLGVPSLATHTHGRHVPHLSYAVLRKWDLPAVSAAIGSLPSAPPIAMQFDAVGLFRRGRCWLVPSPTEDLLRRQARVVETVTATGADLHKHYRPGLWTPHCSLAPRVPLSELPVLSAAVYDVLPLTAQLTRAELIDSSTGARQPLPVLP